jgi:hypothetical protein
MKLSFRLVEQPAGFKTKPRRFAPAGLGVICAASAYLNRDGVSAMTPTTTTRTTTGSTARAVLERRLRVAIMRISGE